MVPIKTSGAELGHISAKDVEGLVLEIKENLRVSVAAAASNNSGGGGGNGGGTMKAVQYSHLSRKSSRASPYRLPASTTVAGAAARGAATCCTCTVCDQSCPRLSRARRKNAAQIAAAGGGGDVGGEDPYELLQRLLRDGSLVNEAVRRLQYAGYVQHKEPQQQRFNFYESDDDVTASPRLRLCPQEN